MGHFYAIPGKWSDWNYWVKLTNWRTSNTPAYVKEHHPLFNVLWVFFIFVCFFLIPECLMLRVGGGNHSCSSIQYSLFLVCNDLCSCMFYCKNNKCSVNQNKTKKHIYAGYLNGGKPTKNIRLIPLTLLVVFDVTIAAWRPVTML